MNFRDASSAAFPTKLLVVNGLAVALVFIAAKFVHIRIPVAGPGGMIHFGDLPLFVFALLFGRKTGAIAGAVGLTLFDLLSGWPLWAPFTFIIAGAAGYTVGYIAEKNPEDHIGPFMASILIANLLTVAGYYLAEAILYGHWLAPTASVPVNFLQVTLPAFPALPMAKRLKKLL